jgi:segregation and condensation protein A
MSNILVRIQQRGDQYLSFVEMFDVIEGRAGVVVTFIAMLELIKESLIEMIQTEPFAPIHVRARATAIETDNLEPNL